MQYLLMCLNSGLRIKKKAQIFSSWGGVSVKLRIKEKIN